MEMLSLWDVWVVMYLAAGVLTLLVFIFHARLIWREALVTWQAWLTAALIVLLWWVAIGVRLNENDRRGVE